MGLRCRVLLRHRHDIPITCHGDVLLIRLGDFPPKHRWVFSLRCMRCRWNVQRDVFMMSLRGLVARWDDLAH